MLRFKVAACWDLDGLEHVDWEAPAAVDAAHGDWPWFVGPNDHVVSVIKDVEVVATYVLFAQRGDCFPVLCPYGRIAALDSFGYLCLCAEVGVLSVDTGGELRHRHVCVGVVTY